MRTGGQSLPFSAFSRAPESCFFLYPAARHRMPRAHAAAMLPDGLVQGGLLRDFAGPPRRCLPMGSSKAAFCGILQGRRGDASRWARLRRLSAGFSNGGAARSAAVPFCPSLPRRPAVLLSLPAARHRMPHEHIPVHANRRAVPSLFHIFLPPGRTSFFTQPSCQRYRAPLFLHPFVPLGGRDSAAFFAACTGGGVVRSLFALSAARPALHLFFYTPPPGERMPRVRSRPCEPAGSPFPFPHFPTARPYFFLYPAVLPTMPRATFPASFCPAGRQGQRRFLCRLHGRRSSALPFRPIGGAPGTAPLFLHPAARHRMPRTVAPSIQTAKTTPLPFPMLPGDGRAHANRRAVPSISTLFRAHPALPGGGHARLIPPAPARGCSCSRLLPPHLSFDFRPALPSAQPTPVRASLPRRFLRFRAALFPAAARCIRPRSCAGGRIAPFFRLSPRAPRTFPSQRSLRAGLYARSAHARPCSCAGGRIAPFFRLSLRAPRAFLALRPLCARPVRIASRRGKL